MNKFLVIGGAFLVLVAFIIVTLGVTGFFNNKVIETAADAIVKAETGVDVEQIEEKLLNKK